MGAKQEILKTLEESGSSSPPRLPTLSLTDELDWSLNLNEFELSLISEFISDGSSPGDEALPELPQHQSKSPENSACDATLPAIDEAPNMEVVSGGKDRRAPTVDTEAFQGRKYRGVRTERGGKFGAKIKVQNPEKKGFYKDLWLGTFITAEEAAMAFDRAALKYRGSQTVFNFPHLIGNHDEPESPKIITPRKGRRSRRVHRRLRR